MRSHFEWDETRNKFVHPKYYKYLAYVMEQKLPQGLLLLHSGFWPPKNLGKGYRKKILSNSLVRMLNIFFKKNFFHENMKKM